MTFCGSFKRIRKLDVAENSEAHRILYTSGSQSLKNPANLECNYVRWLLVTQLSITTRRNMPPGNTRYPLTEMSVSHVKQGKGSTIF